MGLEAILQEAWVSDRDGCAVTVSAPNALAVGDGAVPSRPGHYWTSHSTNKNLWNCLRAFIWHTEQFAFEPDFNTAVVGNSLLAVELPFKFDLGVTIGGVTPLYCGHLDRVVETQTGLWVEDYKTTKHTLSSHYFAGYMPSTQLPGYDVAARIVLQQPVQGVVVSAMQIGVNFTRHMRGHILLGEARGDEWLHNAQAWIHSAYSFAFREHHPAGDVYEFATLNAHLWPMNTESCYICAFKPVCERTASIRKHLLEEAYTTNEPWDPLARQGGRKAAEVV